MWQPIPFHSIHTPPCYTPVGSAHMVGNSAKPREPVRFSVLLKDTDKGRVNTERSNYQDTLLNIFASQVSTAATVSLTPRSYPCWCEPCLQWYFVLKWITLHSHVNDLWMSILFGPPVFSSIFLGLFFVLSQVPLPWIATPLASPSQKPMQGRQSNPTQETSQPVIAGSQWGGRVLIFIHQTPCTT